MSDEDVSQLVALAKTQFGDTWPDYATRAWIHETWRETKDTPRPRTWGQRIRKLQHAVHTSLESTRSRSPPQHRRPPSIAAEMRPNSSEESSAMIDGGDDARKRLLVARLMYNIDAELPQSRELSEAHVPLETMDDWIRELHMAVKCSRLCSWDRIMKPRDQGIQSIGLATLNYGYKFKFRFHDDQRGDLLYHGTSVGNVFQIIRGNFRPRRTATLEDVLKKNTIVFLRSFGFLQSISAQPGIRNIWRINSLR